jgi:hypothetical protein
MPNQFRRLLGHERAFSQYPQSLVDCDAKNALSRARLLHPARLLSGLLLSELRKAYLGIDRISLLGKHRNNFRAPFDSKRAFQMGAAINVGIHSENKSLIYLTVSRIDICLLLSALPHVQKFEHQSSSHLILACACVMTVKAS